MWIPVDNWQFWAATLLAVAAALWLARSISPLRLPGRRRRRAVQRVRLTVEGAPLRRQEREKPER